jgi:predicted SnoaL-like aldol condensation-catalyzing enzyme
MLLVSSATAQDNYGSGDMNVTIEENKQLISRLFAEVFNGRDLGIIDELYDTNIVDHSAFPDQAPGRTGIEAAISGFFDSFDSLKIEVDDLIAEGDKVVTRETWSVVEASSKNRLTGSVIHIFRIRDGKITEEWSKGWGWLE